MELKSRLIIMKNILNSMPILEIPMVIGDLFNEYENYIMSIDATDEQNTILMKLEYFRDDLESNHKLSMNDIELEITNLINMID